MPLIRVQPFNFLKSYVLFDCVDLANTYSNNRSTVVPTKSDSNVMFCLQRYRGLRIDRSLVY